MDVSAYVLGEEDGLPHAIVEGEGYSLQLSGPRARFLRELVADRLHVDPLHGPVRITTPELRGVIAGVVATYLAAEA
jgi:hypothetical protein